MSEPVPVLPLEYSTGATAHIRRRKSLRVGSQLTWMCCLVATLLIAFVEVESVLVTGPVIFILGATLLWLGIRARSAADMIVGASHCAICILFFVVVQQLNWSPDDAVRPFAIMGGIYSAAALAATMWLEMRAPKDAALA